MRPIAIVLLASTILTGCARRGVTGSGGDKLCQGTTFVLANNTTQRWFDLMYDGERIATVRPGASVRQAVNGKGRVYFTETPLKPAGNDRSRPAQPQLVCMPPAKPYGK